MFLNTVNIRNYKKNKKIDCSIFFSNDSFFKIFNKIPSNSVNKTFYKKSILLYPLYPPIF